MSQDVDLGGADEEQQDQAGQDVAQFVQIVREFVAVCSLPLKLVRELRQSQPAK